MRLLSAAAVLLLAACDDLDREPGERPAVSPTASAAGPSAATLPEPPDGPFDPNPTAPATYVGRWAAEPGLCEEGAFVFTADALVTAGEVACDWGEVEREGEGWRMNGRCSAEGPPRPANLRLVPAGEGALRIEGAPFLPVTVTRCS